MGRCTRRRARWRWLLVLRASVGTTDQLTTSVYGQNPPRRPSEVKDPRPTRHTAAAGASICQARRVTIPRTPLLRTAALLIAAAALGVSLSGCTQEEVDPLEVTNSATISDITDNTATGLYTVDTAVLNTTSLGTELTLGFTILNSNGFQFSPISTITFSDGTELTCQADDLRRVPSLMDTTDTWDFACDADEFPKDSDGATLVVVDDYN